MKDYLSQDSLREAGDSNQLLAHENAVMAEIGRIISSSLDINEIYERFAEQAKDLISFESAHINLVDLAQDTCRLHYAYGVTDSETMQLNKDIPLEGTTTREVLERRSAFLVHADHVSDLRELNPGLISGFEAGWRSWLFAPLLSMDRPVGALLLRTSESNAYTQRDVDLAGRIANQIAGAVYNAKLFEERSRDQEALSIAYAQQAVTEERNRMARELHDSVTQEIYGISLHAETMARLFTTNQTELLPEHLEIIRDTAKEALAEMRLLIFELQPPILKREGLVTAIKARLEAVEGRSGLSAEFECVCERRLPPGVEEELYGIAREALNNVLKHAQASKILVSLQFDKAEMTLKITDDGIGFDPGSVSSAGKMGLQGMESRAGRVNATFKIDSVPGKGTTVSVGLKL